MIRIFSDDARRCINALRGPRDRTHECSLGRFARACHTAAKHNLRAGHWNDAPGVLSRFVVVRISTGLPGPGPNRGSRWRPTAFRTASSGMVFEELQNAGTIDGLKGTLRSRLVGVLQRRDPGVFASSGPEHQTLWQRAANSLYVEYLASQNYGYSLSVFQPECGLTNQQVMTREELFELSLSGPSRGTSPPAPRAMPAEPRLCS